MKEFNWKIILFFIIIALAIFLRVYHFHDWLIVKADQVRDASMVLRSYEGGPGELPLLGPKAGGTLLRLGPAFYYFQYISAVTFGSADPPVLAYPNLLFSILTLPLFYFFVRRYFSQNWAMALTGAFSFSFMAVEYSRFAWNPNSLPFFTLLFLHALLNIFDTRTQKGKVGWYAAAGLSFAVASQLHFSSFLALPFVALLFLILNRKAVREVVTPYRVVLFLGIILLFYMPVIISDVINKGDNVQQFISSVSGKSSDRSLMKNIAKDLYYFGKYFLRIISGYLGSNKLWHQFAWIFIVAALWSGYKLYRKEQESHKKNFLLVCGIIFFVYILLYIPLAYTIDKPRFFLSVIFIPFVLIGVLGNYLARMSGRQITRIFVAVLLIASFAGNTYATSSWLREMGDSQIRLVPAKDTLILKAKKDSVWWTWGHFEKATRYISRDCSEGEIYIMMSKNERDYMYPIEYALEAREEKSIHKMVRGIPFNSNGCYYYISKPGDTTNKIADKMKGRFREEKKEEFGSMRLLRFGFEDPASAEPLKQRMTKEERNAKEIEDGRVPRVYWKDVF